VVAVIKKRNDLIDYYSYMMQQASNDDNSDADNEENLDKLMEEAYNELKGKVSQRCFNYAMWWSPCTVVLYVYC
jgi:hypothetical protein